MAMNLKEIETLIKEALPDAKIEIQDLAVSATCVRVPVYTGHSLAITAGFRDHISSERAKEILRDVPAVMLEDIPTPLKSAGADPTYVGRIRPDTVLENGINLFLSGDNLRKVLP